ncbi:MAG: glutathione S-transferase N-terminal domain-containing protein [Leptospira sp.]|nr:glutathione S-transferase N-terminal domain-containing protein [Leptospira sp.]
MLKLYQYSSCPYCQRVLRVMETLGLKSGKDYDLINASGGTPGREEVVQLGGISQVPFLVDGNVKMYESEDIIQYIKKKYN